jgi:hypothetical protein
VTHEAVPSSDDLGVVDPIRPPASAVALASTLRRLAPYAIGFLVIAVARAIADIAAAAASYGVGGSGAILGLVLGSVPGWLALLVPVAVGWAVLKLGEAPSRVVRGSIAIGLSEVLAMVGGLIGGSEIPSILATAVARMFSALLLAGGLIWLARGLEALRAIEPARRLRRAAITAVAVGLTAAVVELVVRIAQLGSLAPDGFAAEEVRAIFAANAAGVANVLVLLAWTYLAWVLIRADRDPDRPRSATRIGAASGWLAIAWLGASLAALAVLPFASESPDGLAGWTAAGVYYYVAYIAAATFGLASIAAFVAALATGVAGTPAEGVEASESEALPAG